MQTPSAAKTPEWTILKLLNWTTDYFKARRIDSPRTTAEILLAHVLGLERIGLYIHYDQPLTSPELAGFKALIQRRARREPVAYITGRRDFWTLALEVTRDTLIPRPETECLVEEALALLPSKAARVLELGTGSGAIVLALASERGQARCFASDRCPAALQAAAGNARRNGLHNRVSFFCADWLAPISAGRPFDLVVSNPPYIPSGEIARLQPEIAAFEPVAALDGGPDGLRCLKIIIAQSMSCLAPGGHLMLEIGHDQRRAVERLAEASGGYHPPRCRQDYAGHDRVMHLVRKK